MSDTDVWHWVSLVSGEPVASPVVNVVTETGSTFYLVFTPTITYCNFFYDY